MLWITGPKTASLWVTRRVRSFFPVDDFPHLLSSLSFSSSTLPSPKNTKLSHPSLSLHAMIKSQHRIQHTLKQQSAVRNFQRRTHHQKQHFLHFLHLVYCTHKLKKIKSRFPWNMALLYCSGVSFESSRCCLQASRPVYPLLGMWQWALDEWFTLPLAISQIFSWHTPTSHNSIGTRDDDSTRSIRSMKRVVLVFEDSWLNVTNDGYHAEVVHDI